MISVCLPTFNGEKFIKEQIESILPQLELEDEVIISDDSSTDNTIKIIKSFSDKRIILLENNIFKNPIYNLENALNLSKGEFIFLADQDDIWETNKVSICKNKLKTYDLVVSNCTIINEDGSSTTESLYEIRNSRIGFIKNLIKNSYCGCCMAFKSKLLQKCLPFPINLPMHDQWIGLMAEITGNPVFINDKLIRYRKHHGNLTFGFNSNNVSVAGKILNRTSILLNILKRALFNY